MALIAAGVFVGNLLTAMFIWACLQANKSDSPYDLGYVVYAALLFPLIFSASFLIYSEGLPPPLAALVSQ
jgi:hypothetical protein